MAKSDSTSQIYYCGNGEVRMLDVWTSGVNGYTGLLDIEFTGTEEDLLAVGLLEQHMIPPGRKRRLWHLGPNIPSEERWVVRRLKGGRLSVRRDIRPNSPKSKGQLEESLQILYNAAEHMQKEISEFEPLTLVKC